MTGNREIFAGSAGAAIAEYETRLGLGWIFRAQTVDDFGIDAQVESVVDDQPSGRLLAIQLKSSAKKFSNIEAGGWWWYVSPTHASYWLGHSLPVVIVLVDIPSRTCYWAHVNSTTLEPTKKRFKIWVPANQRITTAKGPWTELLDGAVKAALDLFASNLEYLPPSAASKLRALHDGEPVVAAQLAGLLVAHRDAPQKAAEAVLADHDSLLEQGGRDAWLAVAHFAQEHGLDAVAASAYETAGYVDPDHLAAPFAVAASLIGATDLERARELLARATVADAQSIAIVAASISINPGMADPNSPDYNPLSLNRLRFAVESETALFMLAGLAGMRRDEDDAIRLFEAGLALAPDVSLAMIQLAECYNRRGMSGSAASGDRERCVFWSEKALNQRRKWTWDTARALAVLVRGLGSLARFADALDVGAPQPHGSATPQESGDIHVARLMLDIAKDGHRPDLLDPIADAVADAKKRQLLRVEADLAGVDDDDRRAALIEMLDSADAEDLQTTLIQILSLAQLGVDRSELLVNAAESAIVPKYYPSMVTAIAQSIADPTGDLTELRLRADEDPTAATALINAYAVSGRYEEASAAAGRAASALKVGDFVEREVYFLIRLGRGDEAAARLEAAIRDRQVTGQLLDEFLVALGQKRADDGDLVDAAHLFEQAADTSPIAAWNLVACEFNLGHFRGARRAIDRFVLKPERLDEIRLWASVMGLTGWTPAAAEVACERAERISGDEPDLAVMLLTEIVTNTKSVGRPVNDNSGEDNPVDARPAVPSSVHQRAYDMIATITSLATLQVPALIEVDDENFVDTITEMARPADPKGLRNLVRQVQSGQIPLAVLAHSLHKSYSLSLSNGGVGVVVASTLNGNIHNSETLVATQALQNRSAVVVDASVVSLAPTLSDFDSLRLKFSDALMDVATRRDIAQSLVEARGFTASSGSLGWDDFSGRPTFTESDPAAQLGLLRRAEAMEREAERLTTVRLDGPPQFTAEITEALGEQGWVETIELAGRRHIALWSDDVAQRAFARSLGVSSFGTANLLEALQGAEPPESASAEDMETYASDRRDIVRSLIRHGVVDQPCPEAELVDLILSDEGPGDAHLVLTRPAWWQEDQSIDAWLRVCAQVRTRFGRDVARQWLSGAMGGIAAATFGQPSLCMRLLAAVAVFGVAERPSVEDAVGNLRVAARVAASVDVPSPSRALETAVMLLADSGVFDDAKEFARQVREKYGPEPDDA